MANTVKKIREALGLNQADFGRKIGRSMQSVQSYERGVEVSPPVKKAIVELAEQAGLGDLVDDFLAEIEADQTTGPAPMPPAGSHARWHQMLADVLDSGNRAVIDAVQHNLLAFWQMLAPAQKRVRQGKRKADRRF